MSTSIPPPLPRPRNPLVRVLLIGGVCMAAVLAAVVWVAVSRLVGWRKGVHQQVVQRLAAIRAGGLPVTSKELNEWYAAVPADQNAALVYAQAIAMLQPQVETNQTRWWNSLELPRRGQPLSGVLRSNVEEAVHQNALALDLAHQARRLPKARYPLDLRSGYLTELPHLSPLKSLVVLLEFQAMTLSHAGRASEAVGSVSCSLGVARSLQSEPVYLSQLTRVSVESISCRSIERVLNLSPLPDAELADLSMQIQELEATDDIRSGLIGERAMVADLIQLSQNDPIEFSKLSGSDDMPQLSKGMREHLNLGWQAAGIFERDLAFFLEALETNIALIDLHPPRSLAAREQIIAAGKQAKDNYCLISGLILPGLAATATRDAESRARLRAARTALAIERWRRVHHETIPESLSALVPRFLDRVPEDPFDGTPLRFKKLNPRYVVYSIGPNREDDGGKERPLPGEDVPKEQRNRYDLTFIVER